MKTPMALLLFLSVLSFFSRSWGASAHPHEDFLYCLSHHFPNSSNSISKLIYTSHSPSYTSILQSEIRNLRFLTPTTPKPIVIVTPLQESHVQASIYCAKEHGLLLRVRSGGHDYEGLSSISYQGTFVILDLINIRSIDIDVENRTAWVQAGATLGELYYTIAQKSKTLAFPAGVCSTVGVGGHFSGGGYGMMSRKHGLSADNIIDARLIDANGRILDRKSMGEDLFWAIRGGGAASFGVVLAWHIKLVSIPETVTVFTVNRTLEQNASKIVHRWQYVADKIDDDLLLRIFLRRAISSEDGSKFTVQAGFVSLFLGSTDKLLEVMQKDFPELGLVKEDCIEMSWIESVLYFWDFSGQPLEVLLNRNRTNSYSKGKSDYVTEPISENALTQIWKQSIGMDVDFFEMQFSPYGGRLSEVAESATPFPHRAGTIFSIHYAVLWFEGGAAAQNKHLSLLRKFYSFMAPYVTKNPRSAYLNYRDLDLGVNTRGNTSYERASIWGYKYYGNNFKRLVRVKTAVDPTNFFRNEQSIPAL